MTVLKSLLLLQGVVLMVGCAHAHMPQGSGHAPFDELAKVAAEKIVWQIKKVMHGLPQLLSKSMQKKQKQVKPLLRRDAN